MTDVHSLNEGQQFLPRSGAERLVSQVKDAVLSEGCEEEI